MGNVSIEKLSTHLTSNVADNFQKIFLRKEPDENFFMRQTNEGLLYQYPLIFFLVPGLVLFNKKDKLLNFYIIVTLLVILLFHTVYSTFQVRYIYSWLCFFSLPLACLIEKIINLKENTSEHN